MKQEIKYEIKSMKEMMESCYTYGGAEKDSYNYERYILKYKDILGEELFNKAYDEHLRDLKENYLVEHNTYTDCDGLTYSSLVKKS
jgi:hypothetical protein